MAIWNNAYGRNGLLSDRQLTDKDYLDILNSIPINESKILGGVLDLEEGRDYSFIKGPEDLKRLHEKQDRLENARGQFEAGVKSTWEKISDTFFANKLCFFGEYHGVRMHIYNDIISLYGPLVIFANNHNFQKSISKESREYYHNYFKDVLKAFKSDFILYAPEWYGIGDGNGNNDTTNIADLLALENWKEKSSDSVQTMDNIYFEYFK
ncbi:MAG: hypothetical protein Q8L81_14290 [Bacteroidota bacterium]|nr:hypothetical protein [Bacteroidota bacterium]